MTSLMLDTDISAIVNKKYSSESNNQQTSHDQLVSKTVKQHFTIYYIAVWILCGLALLFQALQVSKQTLQDGISNRKHHGCCGSVAEPHGQEG